MSELRVIAPGLLTTIQDLGRWGFQSSGVSVAGPMDPYSHRLANALVGNAGDEATLEVTLAGPELECDDDRVIALAGGAFELTIDERIVPPHTAVALPPRSLVKCGRRLRGARAYLAVEGGIAVPTVFGSRATHLASAMGGFNGRALRAGDRLPIGPRPGSSGGRRGHSERRGQEIDRARLLMELPDGYARVRVLPGPHLDSFDSEALPALQSSPYRIDSRSNRMGFRLDGVPLARARRSEMLSEVTAMGSLQVPGSGQPILLMADRQTTGGYPTIATVITADLGIAGQLAPGDSISFAVCSPAEALAALIARERLILSVARLEPA